MATVSCHTQRNKWENQKIQKFYVKKHKGIASRQHKFPKLSSNSARAFVRNYAQISKFQSTRKYKNYCYQFCKNIQKQTELLQYELEFTSTSIQSYNSMNYDSQQSFTDITLAQYIGSDHPLLYTSSYNDNTNDDLLQIAIQQSLETYHISAIKQDTKSSSHNNNNKHTTNDDHAIDEKSQSYELYGGKLRKVIVEQTHSDTKCSNDIIPTPTKDIICIDLKVTIQLHNVLGIEYNAMPPKQYTSVPHTHRPYYQYRRLPCDYDDSQYMRSPCVCAYKALPYLLKECNMSININDTIHSFCFSTLKNKQYSVLIDEKHFLFDATEHEEALMEQQNNSLPIFFKKHDTFNCRYASERDNRRLMQIAQKCFEKVIHKNIPNMHNNISPKWKYNTKHCKNDVFLPTVCNLYDMLLKSTALHSDIIDVLIVFIGCAQFECVVIESKLNIPAKVEEKDILKCEDLVNKQIDLKSGTSYEVNYMCPFMQGACVNTVISAATQYSSVGIKYDCADIQLIDYTQQRTKKCIKMRPPKEYKEFNKYDQRLRRWDDAKDEKEKRKDMKRKNRKGKVRRRRNRKYLWKPEVKHRRRKRKKKYRKNVYHQRTVKQKRAKQKVNKALQYKNGCWIKLPHYKYVDSKWDKNRCVYIRGYCYYLWKYHQPSYNSHFVYDGSMHCDYNTLKGARSNKYCAPKHGRRNTRLF